MTAKLDGTNGLLQQYDYQAPTTGFSYTFAAGTTVLILQPAGTLATGTVTMPAAPADGMTISFSSTQEITALTVNANTGQSIVGAPTTILAGGAATFVYRLSNTTWYAQVNTAAVGAVVTAATGVNLMTVATSPGTYTKPASVKSIKVTVVGGGGAGGNAPVVAANNSAGGGGGGGTAIRYYPAPSLPGPQPYTVGAAASSSSFGVAPATVITATGGTTAANCSPTANFTNGGAGGAGSGAQVNINGNGGGSGATGGAGIGGSSSLGGAAQSLSNVTPTNGIAGGAYGGGGSGAVKQNPSPAATGGAGAAGVVIIEEFY